MSQVTDFVWGGQEEFSLVGTGHDEDTLRIEASYKKSEKVLRLTLPTLCITYASMEFANAIGGTQDNYPASRSYGPRFFDPAVELVGSQPVEKFTWIRGAHRILIGSETTRIEWYMGRTLVIPRLRIDRQHPIAALLTIPDTPIAVSEGLIVDVSQYADGRQIGGIRFEKHHPQERPRDEPHDYDLWIRVINGETMEPMPEVTLKLFRWDPGLTTPYGSGGFRLVEQRRTDVNGALHAPGRPSDELEAVVVHLPGWRAVARCFRPLPGQRVRFHIRAWKQSEGVIPYTWKASDTLAGMAPLTSYTAGDILQCNMLADPADLMAGMRIGLPCYEARYRLEPRDTLEWLAEAFAYSGIEELANLNGVGDPSELYDGRDIRLPGWYFLYARHGDSLEQIDEIFGLPLGWSPTVGRVHHPDPRLPYESETIAVPGEGFVSAHSKHQVA
jgi:hypothetical protein